MRQGSRGRELAASHAASSAEATRLPSQFLYATTAASERKGRRSHAGISQGKLWLSGDLTTPLEKRDSLRAESVKCLAQGNARSAITKALESVRIMETQGLGSTSEALPECMVLTRAYFKLDDFAEARFYLRQCEKLVRSEPYEDETTNVALYSMLAELYMIAKEYEEARVRYAEYMRKTENLFGPNHIATSDCYNVISAFYTHRGQYAEAIDFCQRALSIRIEQLGTNHRFTADSRYNLGLLLRLHGKPAEARREFALARQVRELIFGPQSLEVAEVELSLGFTEYQLGNLGAAHELCERSYAARRATVGKNHPDTAEALNLLDTVRTARARGELADSEAGTIEDGLSSSHAEALPSTYARTFDQPTLVSSTSGGSSFADESRRYDRFLVQRTLDRMHQVHDAPSMSFQSRVMQTVNSHGSISAKELQSRFAPRFPREVHHLLESLEEQDLLLRNADVHESRDASRARWLRLGFQHGNGNDSAGYPSDLPGAGSKDGSGMGRGVGGAGAGAGAGAGTGAGTGTGSGSGNGPGSGNGSSSDFGSGSGFNTGNSFGDGMGNGTGSGFGTSSAQESQRGGTYGAGGPDHRSRAQGSQGFGHEYSSGEEMASYGPVGTLPGAGSYGSGALPATVSTAGSSGAQQSAGVSTLRGGVAGDRRAKVVELTGEELWQAHDVETFCAFGLLPMLLDKREAEKKRAAEKARKDAAASAGDQNSSKTTTTTKVTTKVAATVKKKKVTGPKSDTKRVHWDVLEDTEGTIWDSGVDSSDIEIAEVFGDLKSEFSNKAAPKKLGADNESADKAKKPKEMVLLADPKRRQNMSIFAKTLMKGGRELYEVGAALRAMDLSKFGPNALASLQEFLPQGDETEAVQSFVDGGGDRSLLGPAERFVDAIGSVPRLSQRIRALTVMSEFDEMARDAVRRIELVRTTSNRVRESTRFARLLSIILKVGNELNKGTEKGEAQGVRLASLVKLSQTKSAQNTTLLQYIVEHLIAKDPHVLEIADDFPDLAEATRCNMQTLSGDVARLGSGLAAVEHGCNAATKAGDDDDFLRAAEPFLRQSRPKSDEVSRDFKDMEEAYEKLCQYVGESAKAMPPEDLFQQLLAFTSEFGSTVKKVRDAAARKERRNNRQQGSRSG
ncbi:Formin-F [Hondaea fermentalgiana]|uniref:Formin-F n=1 Tax=Hondaea fermentalgiana TaxID=2315210 RepID=A0A2R5G175_9STRA|nr:Formin-F [Hondaea fermentalgiana]|eukprot:GBG24777.1 Formin-F [Hondaea fermentalgiana]